MDELCPLCLKMGNNKRIKAVQINFEEAVWTCENEDCAWPFGYEAPTFLPRKVGSKHTSKWEVYKKVQKHVGLIPVSTELSLYTPPVTPSSDTASKESTKSEFSAETNISEHLNRMGNHLRCPNDSYAPKSSSCDDRSSDELTKKTRALNSREEQEAAGLGQRSPKAPIPQSIFDIDGKELPSDKIKIEDNRVEPTRPDSASASLEILDIAKSEKPIETVLKARANEIVQKNDEKIEEEQAARMVEQVTEEVIPIHKTIPWVGEISHSKVDPEIVTSTKLVVPKEKYLPNDTKSNTVKKVKIEGSSMKSEILPTPPTLDETQNSKQHTTTTITLEGSLPITLSYDLAHLEEKFEVKDAQTSLLIVRENSMENSQGEAVEIRPIEPPVEMVKKQIRPAAKRRAALIGKQYEKFRFNGLKTSPESKKGGSDVLSNQRVKLDELKIEDFEHSPTSDLDGVVEKKMEKASSQSLESLISGVVDSTESEKVGDDRIENLNLSVLDDILLDGYQNATANINDDWLESFLTTLDT